MQQRQLVVMQLLLSIVYTEKYEPCKRTFRKKSTLVDLQDKYTVSWDMQCTTVHDNYNNNNSN